MVVGITVLRCLEPVVNEEIDSFDGEDSVVFAFDKEMDGKFLIFSANPTYSVVLPDRKIDVAKYFATFQVETDGGGITPGSLYPACCSAVAMLVEILRFPAQWRKIPRNRIVCPTLSELEKGLLEVVDWYNAKLN